MLTKQPNRPFCQHCKTSLAKQNGISKYGYKKWHKYCASCSKTIYNPNRGYLVDKKNKCEKCGFIPEDRCQLDVIYKDGDKKNKDRSNIRTYCANCSRLYNKKQRQSKKSLLDITADADVTL